MLEFQLTQRGQIPVDPVAQAIVEAHRRAVTTLLNEVTKNLSGRVVQSPRAGPRPARGRSPLRSGLMAKIVQAKTGETVSTVGFDKRVAFIARFLEQGTGAHDIRPKFRGRFRRGRQRRRGRALAFVLGGAQVFTRRVRHPGVRPRPILASAVQQAEPAIRADFAATLGKALDG